MYKLIRHNGLLWKFDLLDNSVSISQEKLNDIEDAYLANENKFKDRINEVESLAEFKAYNERVCLHTLIGADKYQDLNFEYSFNRKESSILCRVKECRTKILHIDNMVNNLILAEDVYCDVLNLSHCDKLESFSSYFSSNEVKKIIFPIQESIHIYEFHAGHTDSNRILRSGKIFQTKRGNFEIVNDNIILLCDVLKLTHLNIIGNLNITPLSSVCINYCNIDRLNLLLNDSIFNYAIFEANYCKIKELVIGDNKFYSVSDCFIKDTNKNDNTILFSIVSNEVEQEVEIKL